MFLADYLYSSRLYIYVVDVGSIVEAIEAHPQDSFSLPSVRSTKNGGLKKKGLGWTGISTFVYEEMFLGQRGPAYPLSPPPGQDRFEQFPTPGPGGPVYIA